MGDRELLPEIYRDGPAAALIPRDVVTATGPDTEAFLQGQLSQDVAAMAVGDSAPSFLLQPMGKVDAWLRVTRTADDTFLLDVDAGHGEAMLTRLTRFKLRTNCDLALETWTIKAVRADGREHDVVLAAGIESPDGAVAVVGVDGSWGPIAGHDILGPTCTLATDDREASAADFETLRVLAGVPAMGAELTEDTIPAEAGVVEQSVSFTKGCYTGQELVARIDSRGGNVPKHLRGVVGADDLAVGAAVVIAGDEVGAITSAAGRVGLAYIKRAVDSFPVSRRRRRRGRRTCANSPSSEPPVAARRFPPRLWATSARQGCMACPIWGRGRWGGVVAVVSTLGAFCTSGVHGLPDLGSRALGRWLPSCRLWARSARQGCMACPIWVRWLPPRRLWAAATLRVSATAV